MARHTQKPEQQTKIGRASGTESSIAQVPASQVVVVVETIKWNAADLGTMLGRAEKSEEALTSFTRAHEIDPYFDQPWCWRAAGLACMNLHRYADALSMLSRARVRAYPYVALMAGCHARLGDMTLARAEVSECLSMKPDLSVDQFLKREPLKTEAEQLASSLRLAGLPD